MSTLRKTKLFVRTFEPETQTVTQVTTISLAQLKKTTSYNVEFSISQKGNDISDLILDLCYIISASEMRNNDHYTLYLNMMMINQYHKRLSTQS